MTRKTGCALTIQRNWQATGNIFRTHVVTDATKPKDCAKRILIICEENIFWRTAWKILEQVRLVVVLIADINQSLIIYAYNNSINTLHANTVYEIIIVGEVPKFCFQLISFLTEYTPREISCHRRHWFQLQEWGGNFPLTHYIIFFLIVSNFTVCQVTKGIE